MPKMVCCLDFAMSKILEKRSPLIMAMIATIIMIGIDLFVASRITCRFGNNQEKLWSVINLIFDFAILAVNLLGIPSLAKKPFVFKVLKPHMKHLILMLGFCRVVSSIIYFFIKFRMKSWLKVVRGKHHLFTKRKEIQEWFGCARFLIFQSFREKFQCCITFYFGPCLMSIVYE